MIAFSAVLVKFPSYISIFQVDGARSGLEALDFHCTSKQSVGQPSGDSKRVLFNGKPYSQAWSLIVNRVMPAGLVVSESCP